MTKPREETSVRTMMAGIALAALLIAGTAAADVNVRGPDLKVKGKGWSSYKGGDSPEGAYMGWLKGNAKSTDGVVSLPEKLEPGTYYVFVKGINYGDKAKLQVSGGGGTSSVIHPKSRDWNRYWSGKLTLQVKEATDKFTVTLLKTGKLSGTEKFLLRGLYITDRDDVVVDPYGTVIKVSYPTVLDKSPAIKGNLIPNGSFEAGFGHGWGPSPGNRNYSVKSFWDRTQGYRGKASLKLPRSGRLVSRVLRVRPNRKYTLSFWAKPDGKSASLRVYLYNVNRLPGNLKPVVSLREIFTVKAGWQRYSMSGNLLDYPNNEYQIRLIAPRDTAVWVDALQLEEGELSEYRAKDPLEIGFARDRQSNIFFEDKPTIMQLVAHNGTDRPVSAKVRYEVYDYMNRKVKEGSVDTNAEANGTWQKGLDLSTGKRGIFRVVAWVDKKDGVEEEASYCVVPRPRVGGPDESSMIGIHANSSDCQYEALKKLGVKWQRIMSPTAWFRWKNIEPEKGKFVWYDKEVEKTISHGFQIMGTIGTNNYWPEWADRGGKPDLDEWENSVFKIADHYKGKVKYWEIWNEPIYEFKPPFYADMMKRAARSIRRADPKAKIIGMGGSYKCSWCLEVIKNLENKPAEYMDYIATHLYPAKADPRNPSDGSAAKEFYEKIIVPYKMPVWNTETGAWCLGFYKGPNSSFTAPGEALWPHKDGVRYYRGASHEALRVARNFLHSIGNGFTRYFYYDSRFHASPGYIKSHPTIFGFDDTVRSKGAAYAVLAYLFDHSKGLGNISPNENTYAYLFDRGGTPLVALWVRDNSARTITVGIESSKFSVYDMMGNPLDITASKVPYDKRPVYLEGRKGLSVAAMRSAIEKARVTDVGDKIVPNLSISEAPRGLISRTSVRIRWIAIDETSTPANTAPDAILYSYRLVGRDKGWSDWVEGTCIEYSGLGQGIFRFEVKAKDAAGNVSDTVVREFRTKPGD